MDMPPPPEGTRLALLEAGLMLFGTQGFAASSVRQIAAAAGANIAAIAYHFGGKDGLRLACAEEFGRRMGAAMAAGPGATAASTTEARAEIHAILRSMLGFLLGDRGAGGMVPFMLRELAEAGPGVEVVYRKLAEPSHRRLCNLWGQASGQDPDSAAVRLTVFSLIGQIMYFRIGQPIVTRRMGWSAYGPDEIDLIARQIARNLDAMLGFDPEG